MNKEEAKKYAENVWEKLLAFSGYGFNKSHSVSYTLMSYWSQFAKYKHPLEFWTTSLQFADEEDIPKRISELKSLKQGISVKPPDVNYSDVKFACNSELNSIFWSIGKIKGLGEATTPQIIEERKKNGRFLSMENFKSRFAKKDVNRGKVIALILAGAFDNIEGINYPEERIGLVKKHYDFYKLPLPDKYKESIAIKRYWWINIQKSLTGFGIIDFREMLNDNKDLKKYIKDLVEPEEFLKLKDYSECNIVGSILYMNEKDSKNGKWLKVTIISNNTMIHINIWNPEFEKYKEALNDSVGKMFLFTNIKTKFTEFQNLTVGNSTEKTKILDV